MKKKEVIEILKDQNAFYAFTDQRYNVAKSIAKNMASIEPALKNLFRINSYYKAKYIADTIIENYGLSVGDEIIVFSDKGVKLSQERVKSLDNGIIQTESYSNVGRGLYEVFD